MHVEQCEQTTLLYLVLTHQGEESLLTTFLATLSQALFTDPANRLHSPESLPLEKKGVFSFVGRKEAYRHDGIYLDMSNIQSLADEIVFCLNDKRPLDKNELLDGVVLSAQSQE